MPLVKYRLSCVYSLHGRTGLQLANPLSENKAEADDSSAPDEGGEIGGRIELNEDARAQLASLLRTRRHAPAIAKRIQGLLLLADGLIPSLVARRLGVSVGTVMYWRRQFGLLGHESLKDGRVRR